MLYILIFFYSWVYQLDIYLVNVFFMFNVWMFNIEKKKKKGRSPTASFKTFSTSDTILMDN